MKVLDDDSRRIQGYDYSTVGLSEIGYDILDKLIDYLFIKNGVRLNNCQAIDTLLHSIVFEVDDGKTERDTGPAGS